jgi:uncharacterized membrane protein YfhO
VGESRIGDIETLLDPAFDPARAVVLPEPPPLPAPSSFHGQAQVVELLADRVRVDVDGSAPGLLVLADAYDPGWRARVDGEAVPVLRANVAFRAVPVPAGRHRIDMVYRPWSVPVGFGASLASAIVTWLIGWSRLGSSVFRLPAA